MFVEIVSGVAVGIVVASAYAISWFHFERRPIQRKVWLLWGLLNDIDEAEETAKGDDELYRSLVKTALKSRTSILSRKEQDVLAWEFRPGRARGL